MSAVSIAIIAKNEERNLARCLDSVSELSDDIIVVLDTQTTDESAAVAKKFNCRIYYRDFDNFSAQKNYALSLCKNDWVLALDADELASQGLVSQIKHVLSDSRFNGYKIPRKNYFFGKLVAHTNWSSSDDSHVWLFKKAHATWIAEVHEEINLSGSIGVLTQPKIHFAYQSVEQFLNKMNQYTSYESRRMQFNVLKLFVEPGAEFFRRYIVHLGFLDGWMGLFLSYLMGMYKLVVLVKAWQNEHVNR